MNQKFPTAVIIKDWIKTNRSKIGAFVVLFLFMWLVWPTPYRYYKDGHTNYRENRFTGKIQGLRYGHWE